MTRFLVIAFTLVLLVTGVFAFTLDTLGLTPSTSEATFGFGDGQLPVRTVLAVWSLEALGLMALYLMVQGRWGSWWQDGLTTGWIAWVFRGPLLVLTVAGATSLNPQPWWEMALRWFLLYSLLGLVVAFAGRHLDADETQDEPGDEASRQALDTTDTAPRPSGAAEPAIAESSPEGPAREETMTQISNPSTPGVHVQKTDHPPIQEPPRESPAVDDPPPHDPPQEAPGWQEPPANPPGDPGEAPVEDPPAPHRDPHPDEIEPPPPPPPREDPDLPGPAPEPHPAPIGDPPREL